MNNSIRKKTKDLNKHYTKEGIRWQLSTWKVRELQIKTTTISLCTYPEWLKWNTDDNTKSWWGCREIGSLITACGNTKWCSHSRKQFDSFLTLRKELNIQPSNYTLGHVAQRNGHLFSLRNLYTNVYKAYS